MLKFNYSFCLDCDNYGLKSLINCIFIDSSFFFVEVDTGTMALHRSLRENQSSFYRKLLAYAHSFDQRLHTKHFGMQKVRVLVITSSKKRVANLRRLEERFRSESHLRSLPAIFLYTDKDAFDQANPLELAWLTGKDGSETNLL